MRTEPHSATSPAAAGEAAESDSWRVALIAIMSGIAALSVLMFVSFGPRVMPLPVLFVADLRTGGDDNVDIRTRMLYEFVVSALVDDTSKTIVRWRDSGLTAPDSARRLKGDERAGGAKLLRARALPSPGARSAVSFELTDAATGELLWERSYDPNAEPFLLLAVRIANDVARAFGGPPIVDPDSLEERPREAEEEFWRARLFAGEGEAGAAGKAVTALEHAIKIAPDYAAAHEALAQILAQKTGAELGRPSADTLAEADRHLQRARAIDEDAVDVGVADALIAFYRLHDRDEALDLAEDATWNEPNNAAAWQTRAMAESALGLHDRAEESIERARRHEPLSASIAWDRVWFLYVAGQAREAKLAADEAKRVGPSILIYEALIAKALGEEDKALTLFIERAKRRGLGEAEAEEISRLAAAGKRKEAYTRLANWSLTVSPQEGQEIPNAILALGAGDRNAAMRVLAKMSRGRESWLWAWLAQIPALAELHEHPRWKKLVTEMEAPAPELADATG